MEHQLAGEDEEGDRQKGEDVHARHDPLKADDQRQALDGLAVRLERARRRQLVVDLVAVGALRVVKVELLHLQRRQPDSATAAAPAPPQQRTVSNRKSPMYSCM